MNSDQNQLQNEQLGQVFQFKKEKFRVEIRKKNLAQELHQRRMKIGSIDYVKTQKVDKKQYFSGYENKYEEEIQFAYLDLADYMEKLDFDGIYDVLIAFYQFIQDDQQMISLKAPKIVQSGVLQIFSYLISDQFDQMQNIVNVIMEIFCNLTTGSASQNLTIYNLALKDKLLKFLDFNLNPNIIDSVLHVISHFCYDVTPVKDDLISQGLIQKVVELYKKKKLGLYTKQNKEFYSTYTWCLSSIASDENLELNEVLELNSVANELFLDIKDQSSAKNLLWYYYRITHNAGDKLSIILASDEKGLVIQKIIDCLCLQKEQILVSLLAFQPLSNFLQANDEQLIIQLLNKKLLDGLNYLIQTCSKQTKTIETIFWSISNIVLLSNDVLKYIISHPIFENIIKAAQIYSDKIQSEAITCLCHIQQLSSYQQINLFYHLKVYDILINELQESKDEAILLKIIDGLYCAVQKAGQESDSEQFKFLSKLEQLNLSVKLDNLQNYPSQIVFEKAIDFIETFYPKSNLDQQ
ncbi:hypothetical protein ABPG72_006103 [Tetrahymena utriculariae]